jgi:uncharacterized membrane protein
VTRLERLVSVVLNVGVRASTACLAAGLLLSLAGGGTPLARVFLHAGVVALLATPVARVVVSIAEYAARRDRLFIVLTTIVFVELMVSVVAALVFNGQL